MKDEVCLPLDDETGGIWFFPRVPITAATIIAIMMTAMRAAIAMSILLFLYHGLNKEEKLFILGKDNRNTYRGISGVSISSFVYCKQNQNRDLLKYIVTNRVE
jgi:hypothetical protein